MAKSTMQLITTNSSRYLQQLCKHFAHKVPVEFTPSQGHVKLPFGDCVLSAGGSTLDITVDGKPEALGKLENFIGSHLERFAFREKPTLTWVKDI